MRRRWLTVAGVAALALGFGLFGSSLASSAPSAGRRAEPPFPPDHPERWRLPDPDFYGVAARGELVWAVGEWGAVWISRDGGESFEAVDTPTRETLYDVAFADDRHGWAVGAIGTILRTEDGGRTWRPQKVEITDEFEGPHPLDTHLFGVAAVSAREAWAVGDLGIVLHTTDGEHWDQVRIPPEAFADDNVPDRVLNAVAFADPQHGWIVGEFATTLRTDDGGAAWHGERRIEGAPNDIYLFDVVALDPEHAAASGLAGTVLLTDDAGQTWKADRIETTAGFFGLAWDGDHAVVVGDRGELFLRIGSATSWLRPKRPRLFNWLRDAARAEEARWFVVGEKGLILRSEDAGASWKQVAGEPPPPFAGVSVPEPSSTEKPGRIELPATQPAAEPRS